jgi:hypothetical protein
MAQTIYDKGYEKGEAKGYERMRTLLQRQFEQRFGPLSEPARERLAAWPAEKLPELGEAFVTAQSLKELGLED